MIDNKTTQIEFEGRLNALRMAYDALSPKVFAASRNKIKESDLQDLFDLAQYNYKFLMDESLEINFTEK